MLPVAWAHVLGLQTIFKCKYKSLQIPTLLQSSYSKAERQVLIDSGATDNFISNKLLKQMKIGKANLKKERTIWNVDGTHNKAGAIKHYMDLQVRCGDRIKEMRFLITDIGEGELVLPVASRFPTKDRLEKCHTQQNNATSCHQDPRIKD